jgi:hypothetical protein
LQRSPNPTPVFGVRPNTAVVVGELPFTFLEAAV